MTQHADTRDPEESRPWDERIFEQVPSGVDVTLIDENLVLTPTQRLLRMRHLLLGLEAARVKDGHGLPKAR